MRYSGTYLSFDIYFTLYTLYIYCGFNASQNTQLISLSKSYFILFYFPYTLLSLQNDLTTTKFDTTIGRLG